MIIQILPKKTERSLSWYGGNSWNREEINTCLSKVSKIGRKKTQHINYLEKVRNDPKTYS